MFRIWMERPLAFSQRPRIEGFAETIGKGHAPEGTDPLDEFPSADAVIAAARVRYDGALMDRAANLKVIARTGIGYDNISIPDATARGIAVCNTPDGPTISTAEHAVTLMLAVAKGIKRTAAALRTRGKIDYFSEYTGLELNNRRLGLVGFGRIGRRVARAAQGLGMHVVCFDPLVSAEAAADCGVSRLGSVDEVLATSDVVSLHLPLTAETRHFMNDARLAQMKPGAILINTARGGVIDEAALLRAVDRGHLAGVGLDVFENEPPPGDHPLLYRDNVIATPHIAAATAASKERVWTMAVDQVLMALRGERPASLVNPECWPGRAGSGAKRESI
jgi:D-3-phosphoglycerate dehydrogenase / 2-oxoglutarate reductase